MSDRHQEILDAAYDRWQNEEEWTKEQFWAQLSEAEKVAVFTGNLNFQVQNGGWVQWHGNGYAGGAAWLLENLPKLGPVSRQVVGMVREAMSVIAADSAWEHDREDDVYYGIDHEEMGDLDSRYYEIDDAFMAEVEAFLNKAETEIVAALAAPAECNEAEGGPRYPHVHVKLVGEDGNAFAILCRVLGAMREAGISEEERCRFQNEATRLHYDHLLQTCMAWVEVR